jgi:hypothetical protein
LKKPHQPGSRDLENWQTAVLGSSSNVFHLRLDTHGRSQSGKNTKNLRDRRASLKCRCHGIERLQSAVQQLKQIAWKPRMTRYLKFWRSEKVSKRSPEPALVWKSRPRYQWKQLMDTGPLCTKPD